MTKLFRGAILSAILFGLFLSQSKIAQAQTVKDRAAVVIKIKSVDDLLDSVAYIVGAAGFRNFVPAITLGAGAFLEGMDTARPIGGYMTLDDGVPNFVGFLPVDDLEDVIDMLENNGIEIEEDGDDYIVISPTGEEIIIRGKGEWAFVSVNAEMLEDLPADPSKMVSDISDEYVFAVKANVQRVPADMRSMAIELMEQAFDETYDNLPPAAGDFQRQVNENSLDQLASMIQESDELLMGMAADKKGKRLYMDLSFTGVKGSELAKSLTVSKGAKTAFSNFLEMKDAAMSMNFTQKATEKDVESTKGVLAPFKDQIGSLLEQDSNFGDEDIDLVEGLVVAVMDALIATVDTGSIDMGGAVLIDDEGLNVVAAGRLTDAKKVEAEVKKIAKARGDRLPPQIDFELDAMTYKGVTFHTLSGSIPEANAQEVLGETTTLVVGIAAEKLYVGFGVDPIAKLKKAIDTKSSKAADHLGQVNMTLSPILRMASQASGEQMLADMADQLEDEGNQMIRMTSDVIENGQKTRFELQEGILSLIQMGASGLGGGFGGDF